MEGSNYSPQNEEHKPSLAENIWIILSMLFGILIVAGISDDASETEAELTIIVAGLISVGITLIIRGINKLFDYLNY